MAMMARGSEWNQLCDKAALSASLLSSQLYGQTSLSRKQMIWQLMPSASSCTLLVGIFPLMPSRQHAELHVSNMLKQSATVNFRRHISPIIRSTRNNAHLVQVSTWHQTVSPFVIPRALPAIDMVYFRAPLTSYHPITRSRPSTSSLLRTTSSLTRKTTPT